MKKHFALMLCFLLLSGLLGGCGAAGEAAEPPKGDFSFTLPQGYSLSDIADQSCRIFRDADELSVGGMETTTLKFADLKDQNTDNIMLWLQTFFHKTNNVEYIVFYWGEEHPVISISLRRHGEDGTQKEFYHTLFEKDGCVYHMWFDKEVMEEEEKDKFNALTGVD